MTYSNIKEKFLIEYDKANIASSYPSLMDYEIATLLDKAYLALIAQKLTGNNPRRVGFEGDNKAIEDLRPLIRLKQIAGSNTFVVDGSIVSVLINNEIDYTIPEDFLYYLQSKCTLPTPVNNIGGEGFSTNKVEVNLVSHELASKFMQTTHNYPWVEIPVCCMEDNRIRLFIDPMEKAKLIQSGDTLPKLYLTYIKKPIKFTDFYQATNPMLEDQTVFELNDSMAEELINLAIIMATETVESPRLTTKLNTRTLES